MAIMEDMKKGGPPLEAGLDGVELLTVRRCLHVATHED